MKNLSLGVCSIGVCNLFAIPPTHAQTPLDAGALQQQIERERLQQLPARVAPEKPALPLAMPPSGISITVSQFRPGGNTLNVCLVATGFYDGGHIKQTLNEPSPPTPNSYSRKGHGVSLAWQWGTGLSLRATLAQRDGCNPNPTGSGDDQDGSYDKQRWWWNASQAF